MSDESIPTHGGEAPQCPDCWHAPHWQKPCKCGCPSGIERKKERDDSVAGAHSDHGRNSTAGFA